MGGQTRLAGGGGSSTGQLPICGVAARLHSWPARREYRTCHTHADAPRPRLTDALEYLRKTDTLNRRPIAAPDRDPHLVCCNFHIAPTTWPSSFRTTGYIDSISTYYLRAWCVWRSAKRAQPTVSAAACAFLATPAASTACSLVESSALSCAAAPPCAGARPAMASRLGEAAHAACTASVKETTWFGCGLGFGLAFGFGFGLGLGIGAGRG